MSDEPSKILIVEDDKTTRDAMRMLVEGEGYAAQCASDLAEARAICQSDDRPDLILVDLSLPDGSGMELVDEYSDPLDMTAVIVVTGASDVETAVSAMQHGATDFITKPVDTTRLRRALADLRSVTSYSKKSGRAEIGASPSTTMIGESEAIRGVLELVKRVAPTDAPVFAVGESGTGKELVARAVHDGSARSGRPFVAVNCGAIPPQLTESQLFGHRKGAFTGAVADHAGFFEQADSGTLFLDEVTEMPLDVQVKLLRVLENGKLVRVGDTGERSVDVRIVAATNRDPEEAVTDGILREDLLFRLNVFPVPLPPLRERGRDVVLIAEKILESLNRENEGRRKRLGEGAAEALLEHTWPGNVRELRNVVLRAFILADEDLAPVHLVGMGGAGRSAAAMARSAATRPAARKSTTTPKSSASPASTGSIEIPLGSTVADAEKQLILATLEHNGGAKRETAQMLGISVKTLYNRLQSYAEDGSGDEVSDLDD